MAGVGSPLQAIRAKCLDCTGGQVTEIRECPIRTCPIWPFRMGTNPNRKGLGPKQPSFVKQGP